MPERERFGDFLLHERLAVGGMGELYLATRAERRSPPFALKIMARSYRENPEFLGMFQDEARIGMRLSHSNIVGVHEVGTAEETAFIVMEYVHGENLRSVLRTMDKLGERLAPALAVKLAIDVLRGLDHAHQATDEEGRKLHLVHRDLSPDNILVSYQGDVKLLDFGIAKAEGRTTTTQVGVVKGKPQYMSPEQAKAKIVDARSDLFSAAVVLRELLTGARRFTDDEARWESARNWSPRPIAGLPGELDSILLRALEPEPSRRFQTADEMATELTRVARSGVLPRAKESLPALLKRLFPDASARKFDSTDVTLLQGPRWSAEGTPDDRNRGAVNLATGSSTMAMGPMTFGSIDAGPPPDMPSPPPSSPSSDEDETAPAADLAAMKAAAAVDLAAATTLAVPPMSAIPARAIAIAQKLPTVPPRAGATPLPDDETSPGTDVGARERPATAPVPVRTAPVASTTPVRRPRPVAERPTTRSDEPVLDLAQLSRRQALGALAVLVPLSAVGAFALWRLWPGETLPPKPVPTPRVATPRPTIRRKPTPRPTPKKPTPTPRRK